MQLLTIKLSKSFENAFDKYAIFKSTKALETLHLIEKTYKIEERLEQIATIKKHTSRKVSYRNSKNIHYFIIEKHAVLFRITKTELQVLYFVAAKRIKKTL